MPLERLWAGWRLPYVTSAAGEEAGDQAGEEGAGPAGGDGCVFCRILASDEPPERTYVVWRGRWCAALLNAFPYTSGHLMVMPTRHVADLEDLAPDEAAELWAGVTDAVRALKSGYRPHGLNLGVNLGRPAGAGVPGHVHVHALPRWDGDTNFMTVAAEARVLPEALPDTWSRLRAAWPAERPG